MTAPKTAIFRLLGFSTLPLLAAACGASDAHSERAATSTDALTLPAPVKAWTFESCVNGQYTGSDGTSLACAQGPQRYTGAFDGVGYVQVADAAAYDFTSAMTVGAWARPMTALGGTFPILQKWNSTSQAYRLYVSGSNYVFSIKTSANTYSVSAPVPTQSGRTDLWTHVTGVYDGAQIAIYVNGVKAASAAATGTLVNSASPVYIGRDSANLRFVGRIDEAQLFGQALSDAQVSQLAGRNPDASAPKARKTAFVLYDPIFANGQKLHQARGWFDPKEQIENMVAALKIASGGYADYQITEIDERNEWPRLQDGYRYDETSYSTCMNDPQHASCHTSSEFDFAQMYSDLGFCSKLSSGAIDEIMIISAPYFNTDEFAWKRPGDAMPYNVPTNDWLYTNRKKNIPDCAGKTVFIMGLSYERDLAEAIHSYGHRVESALATTVGRGFWDGCAGTSDFDRYTCIAKDVTASTPIRVPGVGNVHFPFNGLSDYDYGNTTLQQNDSPSWAGYPFTSDTIVTQTCSEWGCEQNGYIQWWLGHVPNKDGVTANQNVKNWWKYIIDYDAAVAEAKAGGGSSCTPTVATYGAGKCGSTVLYKGALYSCISQAPGVNGEPTGCGTAGVYCSNVPPDYPNWGNQAWQRVQTCN